MNNNTYPIEKEEEINLQFLLNIFFRNKRFIFIFTLISILFSLFLGKISKKYWQGQFQIVLRKENNSLTNLNINNIPKIRKFAELTQNSTLMTELEILQSPSVLMPVFEFVKKEMNKSSKKSTSLLFSNWIKSFDFQLKKGTPIMELKYKDSDKNLIIPVLDKMAKTYQEYSMKSKKRNNELTTEFFNNQIKKYVQKSSSSFKNAQQYALENNLAINLFELFSNNKNLKNINDSDVKKTDSKEEIPDFNIMDGLINLEAIRITAASRIRTIDLQIKKIENLKDDYEQIQYIASIVPALYNSKLQNELELIEGKLVELQSKYTEKDESIKKLYNQRLILIKLLKKRAIGFLKADKIAAEALLESSTRPQDVLSKYRELLRVAARDEKSLYLLENNYQLFKIEKARLEDPWELITKPTLIPNPIEPIMDKFILVGLVIGLILSYLIASFRERKKGLIYEQSLLEEKLESEIIEELSIENNSINKQNLDIFRNEILKINNKDIIKVITSNSLNRDEILNACKLIFQNNNEYKITNSFNLLNKDDKIILFCKIKPTIDEINLIRKRLRLQQLVLNGIFLIN